jgi:hypothetical protein
MTPLYLGGEPRPLIPLEQILRFKSILEDIFGQKRWSPRAKQWWTKELGEERDILAEARRTPPPSSDQFKQARNRWLRAILKAKRECWERFLQVSDPGQVWKAIHATPQSCAMPPTLTSMSAEQYCTLEKKWRRLLIYHFHRTWLIYQQSLKTHKHQRNQVATSIRLTEQPLQCVQRS